MMTINQAARLPYSRPWRTPLRYNPERIGASAAEFLKWTWVQRRSQGLLLYSIHGCEPHHDCRKDEKRQCAKQITAQSFRTTHEPPGLALAFF